MLEVRPALPSEYDAVGALTAATYVDAGYAGPEYAGLLADVAGRVAHSTVLVALLDGALAGSVTVVTRGGPFAEQAAPSEAVVRMLATTPAHRGAGVATALIEAALALARADGCSVVRLSTQATMTTAHRIYGRLGFMRTPEHDWSPFPGLDLMTFALPLLFCGQCGEPGRHPGCDRLLALEPPRYCTQCRRRMVVQVHPTGWSARCVEHGTRTS